MGVSNNQRMKTRTFVCFAVIISIGNAIVVEEALLRHILDELATLKRAVFEQQPYEHQKDSERESSKEKVNLARAKIPVETNEVYIKSCCLH